MEGGEEKSVVVNHLSIIHIFGEAFLDRRYRDCLSLLNNSACSNLILDTLEGDERYMVMKSLFDVIFVRTVQGGWYIKMPFCYRSK